MIWTTIGKFLLKWWKEALALIIIGVLLGVIHWKNGTIQDQDKTILDLTAELAVAKSQLSECRGQIDGQNKKIEVAATNSLKNAEAMADLAKSLEAVKKDQKTVIASLRAQPAPKTCEEIKNYLQDSVEELGKW
jgi:peptidoglycan hydrolase CwlO-like protein